LTIFAGVFIFHEARKRQQAKAESRAAAIESAQARLRAAELEQMMAFSQALANSLDPTTLQQALSRYLPAFAGERECWVLTRQPDRWEALLQGTTATRQRPLEQLEAIGDRALAPATRADAVRTGILEGDVLCFPMVVANVPVGALGIQDGASMDAGQRRTLGGATVLIAIAVRNVQLFGAARLTSVRDGLTNCVNRGHGLEMLDLELRRARRSRQPLSIVMFDIDHFKRVNDELGHPRGDDVLRAVGAQLTRVLRQTDARCRYGGDEFLIILPDTPMTGALQVAESIRREMATLALVAGATSIAVTVSVGVASAGPGDLGVTSLVERADAGLYDAKRAGRNRVGAAEPPATPADARGEDAPAAAVPPS
jgi:diguanylate cyclase (GGDEF)-like protein